MEAVDRGKHVVVFGAESGTARRIADAQAREEVHRLRVARAGETKDLARANDIRVAKRIVAMHPVHGGGAVIDRIDRLRYSNERLGPHPQHEGGEITAHDADPRSIVLPEHSV